MIYVPMASVSVVGGIQPGVLRTAIGREHMQDGMCARLLLSMPEHQRVTWSEAIVDAQTEMAMAAVFDRLLSLDPAADEEGNPTPFPMDLTPEAKRIWTDYFNRHRAELDELDDDLASAWTKLEAYTARFALIFQLCTWAAGEGEVDAVDQQSMEAAIVFSDWFGGEAKRVYSLFSETDEDRELRELVELVRRKGGSVTPRDLMRSSRRFPTAEAAEAALGSLVKVGLGRWELDDHQGGRGQPARRLILDDTADVDAKRANPDKNRNCVNVNSVSGPSERD